MVSIIATRSPCERRSPSSTSRARIFPFVYDDIISSEASKLPQASASEASFLHDIASMGISKMMAADLFIAILLFVNFIS